MAAPQIPNLNTLRNSRGAGRSRGRGRSGQSDVQSEGDKIVHDRIIRQTDQDASVSRLSAVETGYLDDSFAKYYVASQGGQRRFPIINRGTYVRTKIIDRLVEQFIDDNPGQKKQIISLGAGTDTRFFRLMIRPNRANGTGYEKPDVIYHEIDFPENIAQKLKPIYELSEFREHVSTPWSWDESTSSNDTQPRRNHLFAGNYCAHPVDLRTLDPSKNSPASFDHIDKSLPTLIISECCLVYLAPSAADAVALYFTQHLFPASTPVGLVLYEPINPNDSFGKVMVSNLAARGIELQTLRKYGSLEAQAARLKAYGFEGSGGADVKKLWDEAVEQKEKERVAGLEMMDEVEEWELLAEHYCVCWGWRGEGVWSSWKALAQKMQH